MGKRARETARYGVNGILATGVHYGVLLLNMEVVGIASAGVANGIAAVAGILSSFLGSRYYVFRAYRAPIVPQFARFGGLYLTIAVVHICTLTVWTDFIGWPYSTGFILATVLQVICSYLGNKNWVFVQGYAACRK